MKRTISEEGLLRFRDRYRQAGRRRKGELLTSFCELTGCHRKSATRILGRQSPGRPCKGKKRGRKSRYDSPEFVEALKLFYRVTDRMCSVLLKGAIVHWMPSIERRRGVFDEKVKSDLLRISARTIERVLQAHKAKFPKPACGTKPGKLKREEIPIRQGIWEESRPGFLESDTVAHCGESMSGMFNWTLTMTDIATHWTECRAVWHKGAKGVVESVKSIEKSLPFELLGFDCDNGGEFLNQHLIRYFTEDHPRKHIIQFTRSREYRKNDNAHVEQRNWSHARQMFYRERLDFYELTDMMNDIYQNEFSLLRNHFYPTLKLDRRVMVLSRYRRIYKEALTPYERVIASPVIDKDAKEQLQQLHNSLDPIDLKQKLDRKMKVFWQRLRAMRNKRHNGHCTRVA